MVTVPALKLFAPMPDGVHSSSEQAAINGTAELGPYTQTDVEPLITARDVDLEEGSVNASSSGHIAMTLSSYMNDSPSTSSSGSNDNEANEPLVEAQDLKTAIIGKLENAGAKKVSLETSPLLNNWIKTDRSSGVDTSPTVPQVTITLSGKGSASQSSPSMDNSRSMSKDGAKLSIKGLVMLSKFLNNANKKKRGILQPSTDFTKRDSTHMTRQRLVRFELPKKEEEKRQTTTLLGITVPLLEPQDPAYQRWSHIMVIPLTYEAWAVPFRMAVTSPEDVWQLVADILLDMWFIVDMLVCLCTAIPLKDGGLEKDKKAIRFNFFRRRFFYYYAPAVVLYVANFASFPIWAWWIGSLVRIPRIGRLWGYFSEMAMKLEINIKKLQIVKLFVIILLSIHWTGCIFYFLARVQDFDTPTWVYRLNDGILIGFEPAHSSFLKKYLLVMYKGMNHLTNVGYDPLRPDNPLEMVWCLMVMLLQIFIAAYILGTLFHHLVAKDASLEDYRRKLAMLQQFMQDRQLPVHLQKRLLSYMEFAYKKNKDSYVQQTVELPRALELRIARCQYKKVVDTCMVQGAPLRNCNEQFMNALLMSLHETYLMPGEEFIKAGDIGRELGFVSMGILDIFLQDQRGESVLRSIHGENLEMPTVVGEISFFLSTVQPHKVACRTTGDAALLVLGRDDYNEIIENYPEQQDIIVANVLLNFGLDRKGNDLPGWSDAKDEDESVNELRNLVLEAVHRHHDDLVNQLTYAVSMGELDLLKSLIRRGVYVDTANYDLSSMTHLAAGNGNIKVLEVLLEEGADINIVDRWGKTPLHLAVLTGNSQAATLLSKHGAQLKVLDPAGEMCTAAGDEDIDQLGRLVGNGIDPNIGDYDARSALHLAAASGAQKSVEYLLQNNANPNIADRWGGLPLMDSIKEGHHMVTLILKRNGALLSLENSDDGTSADQLCTAAGNGDVQRLRLLKDAGVNLDQGDYDDRFALHLAAANGKLLAVSYLLSICADPNVKDRWGSTPIEDALRGNHLHCAKLIQAFGGELGTSPSAYLVEQLEKLSAFSVRDTQGQVSQALAKEQERNVKEMSKEEITATYNAVAKTVENLNSLQSSFQKITLKQRALGGKVKGITYDIWASMQILVTEGLVSPTSPTGITDDGEHDWAAKYHRLEEAINREMKQPLNELGLSVSDLRLYHELADAKGHDSDADSDGDVSDLDGEQSATKDVRKPAEMAKAFQSQVVALLSELQDGYDEYLDEFYQQSRNEETLGMSRIKLMVEKLGCNGPTEEQLQQLISEAAAAEGNQHSDDPGLEGCISCRILWASCPTFWAMIKDLTVADKATLLHLGSRNAAGVPRRSSSETLGGWKSAINTKLKPEIKRQAILQAYEIVQSAIEILATKGRLVTATTLQKVHKSLGEFGGPMFNAIFSLDSLNPSTVLRPRDVMECFLNYLDPIDVPDDSPEGENDEDDEHAVLVRHKSVFVAAQHSASQVFHGIVSDAVSMARLLRSVRLPVTKRALQLKLLEKGTYRKYEPAFQATTGSLDKPLRRQNMKQFLMELFPRYLIRESHAEMFARGVSTNPDGFITWEQVQNWLLTQTELGNKGLEVEEESEEGASKPQSRGVLRLLVIYPSSPWLQAWDAIMRWLALFQFMIVPIQICSVQVQESGAIKFANWITDGLMIVDIVVNFLTAYYDNNSVLVTDVQRIYLKYVSGQFLVDLPLALPLSILAINASLQVQAWLRLPKMFRIHIVYTYWAHKSRSVDDKHAFIIGVLRLLFLTVSVSHVLACIFYFIGVNIKDSWMVRDTEYGSGLNEAVWDQYLLSFFFVLATLSTNGVVGELVPATFVEVLFAGALMIINMTLFAYILGQISSLVMKADDEVAEARGKQAQVDNFIQSKRGITDDLASDIRAFVNSASSAGNDVNIGEIYALMSHSLQVSVAECISRDMLDNVSLFRGCGCAFLDSLSVLLREAQFAHEEVIFQQNEVSKELCYIITGSVERLIDVEDTEPLNDGKSTPGECLGELSFFFGMRHIYTAKACTSTSCFVLERSVFQQVLKMYPDEEDAIASNALQTYEKAWSRAGSQSQASGKSGASSVRSVQETMDGIIGGNLKQTIAVLRNRRKIEAVERTMKMAARNNIPELLKRFRSGISVNATNHDGRTCLHIAACYGHVELAKILLDSLAADTSIVDRHGNTPINDAVRHMQDEVAAVLREHGCAIRMETCEVACILCQAAFDNDLDTLRRYVMNGADPGAGDYDARTALHLAASEGHIELVNYLLKQQLDVNCKDRMGNTPLEDAIRHGHREVQKVLRASGAVLHGHAVTLCEAAAKGDIDTIRVLIENGVDPNEGDYDGRTCLHLAACEDQLGVIHFLLGCHKMPSLPYARAVEVNPVDNMGGTPLCDAIRHDNDVVERMLRKAGGVCFEDPEAMQVAQERQTRANEEKFKNEVRTLADSIVATSKETTMSISVNGYMERLNSYVEVVNTDVAELKKELALVLANEKEYSKLRRMRDKEKEARLKKLKSLQSRVQEVLAMLSEWQDSILHMPTISPPVLQSFAQGHQFTGLEGCDDEGERLRSPDGPVCEWNEKCWRSYCIAQVEQLSDVLDCLGDML